MELDVKWVFIFEKNLPISMILPTLEDVLTKKKSLFLSRYTGVLLAKILKF